MQKEILESIKKLVPGENFYEGIDIALGVEHFSTEMTARMIQKVHEGFSGWNNAEEPDEDVIWRLLGKAALAQAGRATEKDLVDIANLAMILWTRRRARE
jgi:hypothetical protein